MEKLDFMYAMVIIMFVVIVFLALHLSRALNERDLLREDNLFKDALLDKERELVIFYKELQDGMTIQLRMQEELIQMLNDEVARHHGRKTPESYYSTTADRR